MKEKLNVKSVVQILICLVFLLFLLLQVLKNPLVDQTISPDSQLYVGLGKNLINGTGYYDTIRNDQILPPIGHPTLLSPFFLFRINNYFDEILLYSSIVLISLSVWIYSKNINLSLISSYLTFTLYQSLQFLKYGIGTSGVFTTALLLFALVLLYCEKRKSKLILFFSGIALLVNLLVRPTLLYPSIAGSFFILILLFISYKKKSFNKQAFSYRLLIAIIIGLIGYFSVGVISLALYKDKRLTEGTYAGMNLYLSNNQYIKPDVKYKSAYFETDLPEEEKKVFILENGNWEERESVLLNKAIEYIKSNPNRAMQGWKWRLDNYLGKNLIPEQPLYIYRNLVKTAFYLFITGIILFLILTKRALTKKVSILGSLCMFLFIIHILQLMIFSWAGERYLVYLIPYLVMAVTLLIKDIWELIKLSKFVIEEKLQCEY